MAEISKTADQALAALEKLSVAGPMTVAELSRSLDLNRTVVHRLVNTLHRRGFLIRQNGGYAPGAILLRMAARVEPELRAAATAAMAAVANDIGETLVLHVADGSEAVVVGQVVGTRHVVRVEHQIGSRHPLHTAASGRALLAFLDRATVCRVVAATPDPEALNEQLEAVRRDGYAVSHDELQNDVYGLAVAVHGSEFAVASVAVLVPTMRAEGVVDYLPRLRDVASRIAAHCCG